MHTGLIGEISRIEERIQEKLLHTVIDLVASPLNRYSELEGEEKGSIVSKESIRQICLKYRLRFLDIKFFKGDLPEEAQAALAEKRARYGIVLDKLSIIAPAGLFNLERREKDPILLAALPDGRQLIICKWGGEFNFLRIFKALPLRSPLTMILSASVISVLIALFLTLLAPVVPLTMKEFLFGLFITWFGCMAYGIYITFAHSVFPTTAIWNSRLLD